MRALYGFWCDRARRIDLCGAEGDDAAVKLAWIAIEAASVLLLALSACSTNPCREFCEAEFSKDDECGVPHSYASIDDCEQAFGVFDRNSQQSATLCDSSKAALATTVCAKYMKGAGGGG